MKMGEDTKVAVASTTGKAVAKKADIRSLLEGDAFQAQIARVLPSHLKPERFIRIAITAMTKTPLLAECEHASFFNCLLSLSQLGLEPDGRRAHLIPFRNNRRQCVECQLIIDYKGLVELAMRSGTVSNIHADVVCVEDAFSYNIGEIKEHKINFAKPRGDVYAVYAICRFKDGTSKTEVLSCDEVNEIRARSKSGGDGPWVTDWKEMAKKTAFRRLSKWLPLSAEYRDALDLDDDRIVEVAAREVAAGPRVDLAKRLGAGGNVEPAVVDFGVGEGPQMGSATPAPAGITPADALPL